MCIDIQNVPTPHEAREEECSKSDELRAALVALLATIDPNAFESPSMRSARMNAEQVLAKE
jgi:hypothetical protein